MLILTFPQPAAGRVTGGDPREIPSAPDAGTGAQADGLQRAWGGAGNGGV